MGVYIGTALLSVIQFLVCLVNVKNLGPYKVTASNSSSSVKLEKLDLKLDLLRL
jgi:hypothetical protein